MDHTSPHNSPPPQPPNLPPPPNHPQAKNNLLAPVLALFVENGPHTANLVHSAVIELLDFIRVVGALACFFAFLGFFGGVAAGYGWMRVDVFVWMCAAVHRSVDQSHQRLMPLPTPTTPPTRSPTNHLTNETNQNQNQEHLRGLVEYIVEKFQDQITELGQCYINPSPGWLTNRPTCCSLCVFVYCLGCWSRLSGRVPPVVVVYPPHRLIHTH